MITSRKSLSTLATVLLLNLLAISGSHAHLMVPQHGSLNVVNDAIFMVLSLPVSGFEGIDDDRDGLLSLAELNTHRKAMIGDISRLVSLSNPAEKVSLEGIMLSPVAPHDNPKAPATHIVAMGKFTIKNVDELSYFTLAIFGDKAEEQVMKMTVKRKSDGLNRSFELTPNKNVEVLF